MNFLLNREDWVERSSVRAIRAIDEDDDAYDSRSEEILLDKRSKVWKTSYGPLASRLHAIDENNLVCNSVKLDQPDDKRHTWQPLATKSFDDFDENSSVCDSVASSGNEEIFPDTKDKFPKFWRRQESNLDLEGDTRESREQLLGEKKILFLDKDVKLFKADRRSSKRKSFYDGALFLQHVYASLPDILINNAIIGYISEDKTDPSRLQGGKILGPVIPHIRASNVLALLARIGIFAKIRLFSRCGEKSALANTWFVWPIFVIVMLQHNYAEWRAAQHFLIPYIKKFGAIVQDERAKLQERKHANESCVFKVLYCCEVSCLVWFLFNMLISNIGMLDSRSDTLFVCIAVQTFRCDENNQFEELWAQVWNQSMFARFKVPNLGLGNIVLVSFGMGLVQFVASLFGALQRKHLNCSFQYNYGDDGRGTNLSGVTVNHEDTFVTLAESAEMRSIGYLAEENVKLRVDRAIEKKRLRNAHMQGVVSLSQALLERVIFMWMFEYLVQVNIQVTFFALHFHTHKGEFTPALQSMAVSIALGFLDAGIGIALSDGPFYLLRVAEEHHQNVDPEHSKEKWFIEVDSALARARRLLRAVQVCRFILVAALIYAAVKFVAVFVCRESAWNITGCVEFRS